MLARGNSEIGCSNMLVAGFTALCELDALRRMFAIHYCFVLPYPLAHVCLIACMVLQGDCVVPVLALVRSDLPPFPKESHRYVSMLISELAPHGYVEVSLHCLNTNWLASLVFEHDRQYAVAYVFHLNVVCAALYTL